MSTGSSNDYPLSQEYQARYHRAAEQYRLAQIPTAQANNKVTSALKKIAPPAFIHHKRLLWVALAIIVFIGLIVATGPHAALANEFDEGKVESGNAAIVNYRVARTFYFQGDYGRAVHYLTRSVELMPIFLIEFDPAYATPYLTLGEVYWELGQYDEALATYRDYIDLLGDAADPAVVTFVAQFQANFTIT